MNAIFISIKPEYMNLIINGIKNYEFRNYCPAKKVDTLFVYETKPVGELKYIIKLGHIIKYPQKIKKSGIGNIDFNSGKSSKYAFQIEKVITLPKSLSLNTLRSKYGFNPPQGYAYESTYLNLSNYIRKIAKI